MNLPAHVADFLTTCPQAGGGLDTWLLKASNRLRHYITATEAEQILAPIARDHGRYNPSEIKRQVRYAYGDYTPEASLANYERKAPKWPVANESKIAAICANSIGYYDLWEQSPVRFDDDESHTEEVIDILFPGNPILCVGQSNWDFMTDRREAFRGWLSQKQLIVPSPMVNFTGKTKEGKLSEHALDNTSTSCQK
jgi:hypothetical protein